MLELLAAAVRSAWPHRVFIDDGSKKSPTMWLVKDDGRGVMVDVLMSSSTVLVESDVHVFDVESPESVEELVHFMSSMARKHECTVHPTGIPVEEWMAGRVTL